MILFERFRTGVLVGVDVALLLKVCCYGRSLRIQKLKTALLAQSLLLVHLVLEISAPFPAPFLLCAVILPTMMTID